MWSLLKAPEEEHYVLNSEGSKMKKHPFNTLQVNIKFLMKSLLMLLTIMCELKKRIFKDLSSLPSRISKYLSPKKKVTFQYSMMVKEPHRTPQSENVYVPSLSSVIYLPLVIMRRSKSILVGKMDMVASWLIFSQRSFLLKPWIIIVVKSIPNDFTIIWQIRIRPRLPRIKESHIPRLHIIQILKGSVILLEDDMIRLITKRTYDAAAVTDPNVSIFLNEKKLDFKSFEKYTELYLGDKQEVPRIYQNLVPRGLWCVAVNPHQQFEQVSFVNGITTHQDGKHVEYIANQICKKVSRVY